MSKVSKVSSKYERLAALERQAQRLKEVEAERERAAAELDQIVKDAIDSGASISEVARILGVSRQAAHKRYRSGI